MKLIVTLLAFICIGSIYGAEEEKPPVKFFAFGGVGFSGVTSEGEYRFGEAVMSEDPKKAFHRWYKKAKNEGKAYCIIGFYYFDRKYYNELKKNFQGKGILIRDMIGCSAGSITLDTLITQIETEQFKLHLENPIQRPTETK